MQILIINPQLLLLNTQLLLTNAQYKKRGIKKEKIVKRNSNVNSGILQQRFLCKAP
jgi:hypothetical protein